MVNTSVHEALPVSFLESLWCGTPVIACRDPEGVVSRFGIDVGRFGGDGLSSVDAFAAAVRELLGEPDRVDRLGTAGRGWVEATHSRAGFADAFSELAEELGAPA